MYIDIHSKITAGNNIDHIDERAKVDYYQKGAFHYLHYDNSENEKVLLKFNDKSLAVTRFSSPKTLLHFQVDCYKKAQLATPMGLQHLVTVTDHFVYHPQEQRIELSYHLIPDENKTQPLMSCQLTISWYASK